MGPRIGLCGVKLPSHTFAPKNPQNELVKHSKEICSVLGGHNLLPTMEEQT